MEESYPEIRETSWVGLVQRERDEIDLLTERKSRPLTSSIKKVAYLFRFIGNARQKDRIRRSTGELSVDEIEVGKTFVLRRIQSNAYQQEVE